MKIDKIIISGDCLRPDHTGKLGNQNSNVEWCYHLFAHQIYKACNLSPQLLISNSNGIDPLKLYKKLEMGDALQSWIHLYDNTDYLNELIDFFLPYFKNSLAIFFELPPYLKYVLDACEIPHINIRTHPVRFLDDLLLAITSSHIRGQEVLKQYSINEDELFITAGLRKATFTHLPQLNFPANSLLIAGQCTYDATQISNGKLIDIHEFSENIQKICSSYDSLLIKAHPYDENFRLLTYISQNYPNTIKTNENSYFLLGHESVTGLMSVNSSLAFEAKYFKKESHNLVKNKYTFAYAHDQVENEKLFSINHSFFETDFWRDLLKVFLPVTAKDGLIIHPKPNRLRTSLSNFWDFNKIDTDIFVNLAPSKVIIEKPTLSLANKIKKILTLNKI